MAGNVGPVELHAHTCTHWAPHAPVALILLHGFGADERDLAELGPALAPNLPWAALRGPLETRHGGYAWFPLLALGDQDPARAVDRVWQWIDAHLDQDAKVIAVGFSMGGLMASQLLRTRPQRVAAAIMLSGWVLATPQPADERLAAERPAVFWGRGTADRMITADVIERTQTWLPAHSTLTRRIYPGLGHAIGNQEIVDVRAFIHGRIGS